MDDVQRINWNLRGCALDIIHKTQCRCLVRSELRTHDLVWYAENTPSEITAYFVSALCFLTLSPFYCKDVLTNFHLKEGNVCQKRPQTNQMNARKEFSDISILSKAKAPVVDNLAEKSWQNVDPSWRKLSFSETVVFLRSSQPALELSQNSLIDGSSFEFLTKRYHVWTTL